MIKTFKELPDWEVEIIEKLVGVYHIKATDAEGRCVEATGINYEELIDRCKNDALKIQSTI